MSTRPNLSDLVMGDNTVALVNKITEKTKQRKIPWNRSLNGLSASVPGGLKLNIVERSPLSIVGPAPARWVLFTVRDEKGNEILKVENSSQVSIGLPSSVEAVLGGDSVTRAVDELYRAVRGAAKGEIEKAIDLLDKI
jgi:hypothetical protein